MTDPHAWQPVRWRVWGRRHFKFHFHCRVEGCELPEGEHPRDEEALSSTA